MTTTHEQGALFGDGVPVASTRATVTAAAAANNDLDLVASVIATALDPGYVLIGPGEKPYRRDPARPGLVDPIPSYERDMIAQLLDTAHLTIGGTHHVQCGRRDGPARSVLVPKHARAMVERWAALHPLSATRSGPPATSGPAGVRVVVDVVRPGRGLVTCGAGDFSGSIIREKSWYLVETEWGEVICHARSFRDGAQRLARHHGHTASEVHVEHERDPW